MSRPISLILALLFCLASITNAQNFYYAPEGKAILEVSTQKILIKFQDHIDFNTQQQILAEETQIVPLKREMMLPAPLVTIADLQNVNSAAEVYNLLERLDAHPQIEYAQHFLGHKDGTLHGVTNQVLVRLKNEADLALLDNAAKGLEAHIDHQNEFDALLYHVQVDEDAELNGLEVANTLHEMGIFDYAEPDFLRLMKRMNTNDPFVDDQWSLNNDGVNTSAYGGIAGADMKVFDAWATTTGSSSVKVAIVDEGVDLSHPDLLANLLPGYDATGLGSGGGPTGDDAHGTACAGIVAAVGNNNLGVAGVAYSCKIIPVRIAYSSGPNWVTNNTWIGNALNWAWQTGNADILSNSWGGGGSSSTINNAISGAVNNGRGGLGSPVLFAAGNDNGANSYPATYAPTISVIAMSMCNERKNPSSCDGETWWGSNYGTGADVAAPGVKIYATDISGSNGYTSGDYVSNFNGTSSACPNAAGVMALILSVNGSLTEDQARTALESTCDKAGGYTYNSGVSGQPNGTWSNDLGYGRVNAAAAVASVGPSLDDDAGISAINAPQGNICATSVTPSVQLNNYGGNTLSSVTINYQLDGGTVNTYNWTGSLAATSSTTVSLPTLSLSGGSHTFNAYTSSPNGNADSNTTNDDASSAFYSGNNDLTLTIILDNYPEETSWDIQDSGGNVVASGGTYGSSPDGSTITADVCVPDGCYDFTIYDSYGDGICCGYGNGSYTLSDDAGNTLASGGSFGSSETTNFCVPVDPGSDLAVSITASTDVSCNGGNDGSATATATGGTGSYTYSWSNGASGATATGLSAGSYTVTVDDGSNTATANVSISEPSAVSVSITGTNANGGNNGSATASASGGTPGYTYSWSNGGTGATISGLAPGNYTVTATDANGCTATNTVTIEDDSTGGCTYEVIDDNDFESGWGIWNDGGSDARRSANDAAYANSGSYCIRLRDNTSTSVMTTDNLDLTAYEELTVDFSYYARSMDNSNEDFWLQISTNGGSSYTTVEEWNRGDEFENGQRKFDAVVIAGPFTSNTRLRFRCDASGNQDWVYIDDVVISGCTNGTGSSSPVQPDPVTETGTAKITAVAINDMQLFPNPTREELNVAFEINQAAEVQLFVTDLRGQLVQQKEVDVEKGAQQLVLDVRQMSPGYYFVHLISGEGRWSSKFVVVK